MLLKSYSSLAHEVSCALQHVVVVEGLPTVPGHAVEKHTEEQKAEDPMLA